MSELRVAWKNKLVPGIFICPVVSAEQGAELVKGMDSGYIEKAWLEMLVDDEWMLVDDRKEEIAND